MVQICLQHIKSSKRWKLGWEMFTSVCSFVQGRAQMASLLFVFPATPALACSNWLGTPDPGNQPWVERGNLEKMRTNKPWGLEFPCANCYLVSWVSSSTFVFKQASVWKSMGCLCWKPPLSLPKFDTNQQAPTSAVRFRSSLPLSWSSFRVFLMNFALFHMYIIFIYGEGVVTRWHYSSNLCRFRGVLFLTQQNFYFVPPSCCFWKAGELGGVNSGQCVRPTLWTFIKKCLKWWRF